jgi:hypothetical protein
MVDADGTSCLESLIDKSMLMRQLPMSYSSMLRDDVPDNISAEVWYATK